MNKKLFFIFIAILCIITIFVSCAQPADVDVTDDYLTENSTENPTDNPSETPDKSTSGTGTQNSTGTAGTNTNGETSNSGTGSSGSPSGTPSKPGSSGNTSNNNNNTYTNVTNGNNNTQAPVTANRNPYVATSTKMTWPLGQALPLFSAPAAQLDAINIASRRFDIKLSMISLQGVVNKNQPKILVLNDAGEGVETWPKATGLKYTKTTDYKALILKYSSSIKGVVIYKKSVMDTVNVATTIASIEDGIVVSPEFAEVLKSEYNFNVIVDLNKANISNKIDAYNYLYNNYWSKCSRRIIMGLKPDEHVQLRDLAIASKAAVLWLEPKNSEEKKILDKFFADATPIDTYYAGWWPEEGSGVGYGTSKGVITVPADFYENYTVYSGQSRQLSIPTVPAKPTLENNKIYVSLNMSDGDNIQYNQHVMRMSGWWGSSDRGKVPIGWTCSPALLDAGPQILNYYYKTSTANDVLICGPSGLGYSSSDSWTNQATIQKYAEITNSYFEKTAFNIITVWSTLSTEKANWLINGMPSLLGLTTQNQTSSKIRFANNSTPIVWFGSDFITSRGAMSYDQGTSNIKNRLSAAASISYTKPQFYAAQVKSWDTKVPELVKLVKDLEAQYPGRFVFVRPDHFMMLINEANGKPFNTSLQKTVTSSTSASGYSASQAVDGSFTTGWKSSSSTGTKYMQVDLGKNYKISRYVLKNAETAYMSSSLNSKAWKVEVSTNGTSWTQLDTVSGNSKDIVYRNVTQTTARYVRITITDAGSDGYARIQDFEIYGAV